jgi:osmotically-inducible protein OsmY
LTCINIGRVDATLPSVSAIPVDHAMCDQPMTQRINTAFGSEPGLDESRIRVHAAGGVVTLCGHVPSYGQKMAAGSLPWRVSGVQDVFNLLDVDPGPVRIADGDIADRATSILRWDSTIPAEAIAVSVDHGLVRLQGHVRTPCQRAAAARDLYNLAGVTALVNDIVADEERALRGRDGCLRPDGAYADPESMDAWP